MQYKVQRQSVQVEHNRDVKLFRLSVLTNRLLSLLIIALSFCDFSFRVSQVVLRILFLL